MILNLVGLAVAAIILFQQPWFQMAFFGFIQEQQIAKVLNDPPPPSGPEYKGPQLDASGLRDAPELFEPTRIWETHLAFTATQFAQLGPDRIPPVRNWIAPDGTPTLRNPLASRAGVAGTLGFDLPWSSGNVRFGGVELTNVAIRYKGNGTFLEAAQGLRKSFKLDLNEGSPGRTIARQKTLNLHNLVADRSSLSDTLGYEFHREAGVPAPLTTFTRVFLTLDGRWENRLLGLYLMVENPDSRWTRRAFGIDGVTLFKPVDNHLFEDLGTDWADYEVVYTPKTDVPPAHRTHLMDLCKLVSSADDDAFAQRIGDFIDLDAAARYFACEVLLSNYDGILMNGQNFLLGLDPRSGKLGFSPWDLDHSWGAFNQVGTDVERERASAFHPWVGRKRFLERLFAAPAFATAYRRELTRISTTLFTPERLEPRIDALAEAIRPAVAEDPGNRLGAFNHAVGAAMPREENGEGVKHSRAYQLKRFIRNRAGSIADQLSGKDPGIELKRGHGW